MRFGIWLRGGGRFGHRQCSCHYDWLIWRCSVCLAGSPFSPAPTAPRMPRSSSCLTRLTGPGYTIVPLTVWQILRDAGIDPAPRRAGPTWRAFLAGQAKTILAAGFFQVDTVFPRRLYVLVTWNHSACHRLEMIMAAAGEPPRLNTRCAKLLSAALTRGAGDDPHRRHRRSQAKDVIWISGHDYRAALHGRHSDRMGIDNVVCIRACTMKDGPNAASEVKVRRNYADRPATQRGCRDAAPAMPQQHGYVWRHDSTQHTPKPGPAHHSCAPRPPPVAPAGGRAEAVQSERPGRQRPG